MRPRSAVSMFSMVRMAMILRFGPIRFSRCRCRKAHFHYEQQRAVVDTCGRHLLTSHGLRSLSPDDPQYRGHYGGTPVERDGAYHQGTVWAWLLGPFALAHSAGLQRPGTGSGLLEPIANHLKAHGLGSISEIFDGDAPFTPRGCIAQAWSVAEVLRAWKVIEQARRTLSPAFCERL